METVLPFMEKESIDDAPEDGVRLELYHDAKDPEKRASLLNRRPTGGAALFTRGRGEDPRSGDITFGELPGLPRALQCYAQEFRVLGIGPHADGGLQTEHNQPIKCIHSSL